MNNNIQESYCSFEITNLLKEKGFNCDCNMYYIKQYANSNPFLSSYIPEHCFNYIDAPTHALAIEWLRINFEIWISICTGYGWEFNIERYKKILYNDGTYQTPQEATEAALKYILTKLI